MPLPNNFRVDKKDKITSGPLVGRFLCQITFDCSECQRPTLWSVALWDDEIPYVTSDTSARNTDWHCFECDATNPLKSRPPVTGAQS